MLIAVLLEWVHEDYDFHTADRRNILWENEQKYLVDGLQSGLAASFTGMKYLLREGHAAMYNILICDDERDIVNALKIYLNDANYALFEAFDGREALKIVEEQDIHLVLMDIMMPQMDGIEAMVKIRERSNVPVILLTAKSEDADKILGLTVGADDYIKKVLLDGEEVALTPTEYEILKLLMQHPGKVFSPKEIYQKIWNDLPYGSENTVAVHIRHIREKLEINPAEATNARRSSRLDLRTSSLGHSSGLAPVVRRKLDGGGSLWRSGIFGMV